MEMATARIVAGFVATFYFHKCQTRDYITHCFGRQTLPLIIVINL